MGSSLIIMQGRVRCDRTRIILYNQINEIEQMRCCRRKKLAHPTSLSKAERDGKCITYSSTIDAMLS